MSTKHGGGGAKVLSEPTTAAAAAAVVDRQSRKRSVGGDALETMMDSSEDDAVCASSSPSSTSKTTIVSTPELSVDDSRIVINQYLKDGLNRKDCEFTASELNTIARPLLRELMRYLKMKILKGGSSDELGIPREVDHMWHALLLCTRVYRDFCARENNAVFLDHNTESFGTNTQKLRGAKAVLSFYSECFAERPPAIFWPDPTQRASATAADADAPL